MQDYKLSHWLLVFKVDTLALLIVSANKDSPCYCLLAVGVGSIKWAVLIAVQPPVVLAIPCQIVYSQLVYSQFVYSQYVY